MSALASLPRETPRYSRVTQEGRATAIAVESLTRRFRGIDALRAVSLRIPAGSTFGLLGSNGSGKTTLLRLLAGVLQPTSGQIEVLGRSPHETATAVGYMPQEIALYPRITVWENLRYFAGLQRAASGAEIERALAQVGMLEYRHRILGELSQGTQRRASLACTLVQGPRLLLLDEPTAGVDPVLRLAFWDHFERLNDQGVTIVVATHAMDEAARCHALAILREGCILALGSPEAICATQHTDSIERAYIALAGGDAR